MIRSKSKRAAITLAASSLVLLATGCGGSNSSSNPTPGVIPGGQLGGVPGSCVPITGPIPFTGNGVYFDWANIVGGQIPMSYQSVGQIIVGGGSTAGGQYQRTGVDGTISLNVVQGAGAIPGSYPYAGYPNQSYPGYGGGGFSLSQASTVSIQGFVQISPAVQQDILYKVQTGAIQLGYGVGYGAPIPTQPGLTPIGGTPTYGQGICVSQIALNVGHYYNTIYGGNVYLYLNGTQHGYVLYF